MLLRWYRYVLRGDVYRAVGLYSLGVADAKGFSSVGDKTLSLGS